MVQPSAKMGTRLWWFGQMWATRPSLAELSSGVSVISFPRGLVHAIDIVRSRFG